MAELSGHLEVINFLKNYSEKQAGSKPKKNEGNSPLHWAAINGKSRSISSTKKIVKSNHFSQKIIFDEKQWKVISISRFFFFFALPNLGIIKKF